MSLTKANRQRLLELAKNSIQHGLQTGRPLTIDLADYPAELILPRATFVTLQINHQLRGCIGMLEAVRPLAEDIAENAFAAAFNDPRFLPLNADEFADLTIHLSILTRAEPVAFSSEQDLVAQLQPGVDGLILEEGRRRGTFLPSVWESLPEPQEFLRHLKQKAGLPPDYWSDNIRIYRYRAELIGED
ncbi:MAG: AmmeMemoRadiSam system protein A [Methylobacter sp.]|nr:AmmeMemoRadiSam system protein A [Methylobacter sp.]MDP2098076.1 AmmeMemoRadiSam system protein A [Methylobacter sp.]MDP2430080.1 AmmeMemoRadiSam system protein A [Methylobacter sp.]MDP3056895.1 AmmeMemoRadiSam system protein A [Methylobacter sp.]MDP3364390.1 AmmeMemoRadiSam system protein A [Methylobacter sp.]